MAQKEAIVKTPERRVKRATLGRKNILTVEGKDPNYEYRVVNDVGDRVNEFLDLGWQFEQKDSVRVGDKRVGQALGVDTRAAVQVGGGITGYVMKQRKDWYDEDQATKAAGVKATEEATRQSALNGTYGKLDITRD